MYKNKKAILVVMSISMFCITGLWAKKSNLKIFVSVGRSLIFSELDIDGYPGTGAIEDDTQSFKNNNYCSFNYGFILKLDKHLLDINYKDIKKNVPINEDYISDIITGKEFRDYSLKYGRQFYSFVGFNLNAFAGIGYIKRRINRSNAGPPSSFTDEFVTFPLKITLNRYLFRRIGLNANIFCDLNFEEIIYGLEINLLLKIF